jgi:hypothetical protein
MISEGEKGRAGFKKGWSRLDWVQDETVTLSTLTLSMVDEL